MRPTAPSAPQRDDRRAFMSVLSRRSGDDPLRPPVLFLLIFSLIGKMLSECVCHFIDAFRMHVKSFRAIRRAKIEGGVNYCFYYTFSCVIKMLSECTSSLD